MDKNNNFIPWETLFEETIGVYGLINEAEGSDEDADKYKELIDKIISKCEEIAKEGRGSTEDSEDRYFEAKHFIRTMEDYKRFESYIREGRKVFVAPEYAMQALKRLAYPKEVEKHVHMLSMIMAKHSK